ncbi:tyrosine-type recombinase/integrase [Undibacterium sp. Ji83W]|uniref:tyrosine-type recombinase/integrase n=1 Tax=Undibacterium sp. Ji83W TaxID=3413043 RepID=UPI003BF44858
MRSRQWGGKTYYYLRSMIDGKRKEIPLGNDFILALRKYTELIVIDAPRHSVTFFDVEKRYLAEVIPKLSKNTAKIYRSDIRHLLNTFKDAPFDQIKPMNIRMFLDDRAAIPTTANRCKRLFSTMWNHARGWGYTDLPNPCEGIKGHSLDKRMLYVTDAMYNAVYAQGSAPLRDAMDLAYLTGQRPADALRMSEDDIIDGCLIITQSKTKQPLRISIAGELAELMARILARKASYKSICGGLLINANGMPLTPAVLRNHFHDARKKAAAFHPEMANAIMAFHFYDLRAKAADDTSDLRGEQAASDLLGHGNVKTTQRHYLRRGKIVGSTK